MALGTPVVTLPGSAGELVPKFMNYHAQIPADVARVHRQPQVSGYVTTAAAESGAVIDLTAQGFEFLADHEYDVILVGRHSNDANKWRQVVRQVVLGGSTPVLRGNPQLVHAVGRISSTHVDYGDCHAQATYSTDTATAVAANSSAGSSLGNNSTNTITLTHPVARATPKYIKGINASADVATVSEAVRAGGVSATSTTFSLFVSDVATPSADWFDDAGTLDVDFHIEPPPSVALVMATANVQVHVGYDASDLVQHYVDVFIGEGEYLPFGT